jgi:hypothetical protein
MTIVDQTPVEMLGALVVGQSDGRPIRLRVSHKGDTNGSGPLELEDEVLGRRTSVSHTGLGNQLHECVGLADLQSRKAVEWAQLYTAAALGWPEGRTIHWTLTRADKGASQVPPIAGPSIFGLFCLAFIRFVAIDAEGSVKPSSRELSSVVRNTNTNSVAVSAAFSPCTGCFLKVGQIEEKLEALTSLGPQICNLCVVAAGQSIRLQRIKDRSTGSYDVYRKRTRKPC